MSVAETQYKNKNQKTATATTESGYLDGGAIAVARAAPRKFAGQRSTDGIFADAGVGLDRTVDEVG